MDEVIRQISQMEKKCIRLNDLCSLVLTTLVLQQNQKHMHPDLQELSRLWHKQYIDIKDS